MVDKLQTSTSNHQVSGVNSLLVSRVAFHSGQGWNNTWEGGWGPGSSCWKLGKEAGTVERAIGGGTVLLAMVLHMAPFRTGRSWLAGGTYPGASIRWSRALRASSSFTAALLLWARFSVSPNLRRECSCVGHLLGSFGLHRLLVVDLGLGSHDWQNKEHKPTPSLEPNVSEEKIRTSPRNRAGRRGESGQTWRHTERRGDKRQRDRERQKKDGGDRKRQRDPKTQSCLWNRAGSACMFTSLLSLHWWFLWWTSTPLGRAAPLRSCQSCLWHCHIIP